MKDIQERLISVITALNGVNVCGKNNMMTLCGCIGVLEQAVVDIGAISAEACSDKEKTESGKLHTKSTEAD